MHLELSLSGKVLLRLRQSSQFTLWKPVLEPMVVGMWMVYGGFRRHPRSQLCPTSMYHSLATLGPPYSREPPRQSRPSVEVQSRHLGPFPAVIKDVGST
ncbi:uncharacterized protein PRD47_015786 isoform 1-T1 [Ara ararauna]